MNDFTKEELEEIKIAMGWHYMQQSSLYSEQKDRIKKIDALGVKIQSMIDNYCEHELHDCEPFIFKVCSKCDNVIGKL